ncbi:hypothetical protein OG216_19350 [Streptomycetaceae bacterium NBC_01309]
MNDVIRVQPARDQRVALARWAVAQTPKVRTVSQTVFAVPADLFTHMPEELLTGARVNDHAYISPEPEQESGESFGLPGAEADTAAPVAGSPIATAEELETASEFGCGQCDRTFPSERGRDNHRRRAHPED